MTREDDREYWRRQDIQREYREQDYRREQRNREFWQEQDRQRDYDREDAEYEAKRRAEELVRGRRAIRQGNTAEALRNIAGPDAAISYLRATAREPNSASERRRWIRHVLVTEVPQLVENIEQAPKDVTFTLLSVDSQGDVPVQAESGAHSERFWIRKKLLPELLLLSTAPSRTMEVIRPLTIFSSTPSLPETFLGREQPWKLTLGRSLFDRGVSVPHVIVTKVSELVENFAALPDADFTPKPVMPSGDGVVEVRRGDARQLFFVKAPLLAELASLAKAPPATIGLLQKLGRLAPPKSA